MLQILLISAPVYLIIAAGFSAVRFGLFQAADTRVLGRFVVQIGLPALLFHALTRRPLAEVFDARFLLVYGPASLAVGAAGLWWQRLRGRSLQQAALTGLGMSSSNSGFLAYPIVVQVLGPTAAVGLALAMLVENLLMVPLALALAERGDAGTRSFTGFLRVLSGLPRSPIIQAMAAGLLISALEIPLPEVLTRTIGLLATASSPLALFVIGGSLVGLKPAAMRADLALIAGGKLLLHPLAVLGGMALLPGMDPGLRVAAVLYASAPMLSIYPVLAMRFELDRLCAAALLIATTLSFITITAWLWLLRAGLHWLPVGA